MFNLKYLLVLLAIITVGISAAPALAQNTAPVRGVVKLRATDGTETPVVGAAVESYQIDVGKGVGVSTTTNKRGEFTFAGFQLGHVYSLAVSGPGIAPVVQPNVKPGADNVEIIVSVGDGRKATEDEVRKFSASGLINKPADNKAQAKEDAEYQKKVAEYNEQKKKAEDSNKIVNAALKDGIAAFQAKNFELAAQKFDEGYQADPDFEGSAPIMIRNKGVALREWGIMMVHDSASGDAAAKAAALEKAKANFTQAEAAFQRAIEILDKAPAGADAAQMKQSRLETYREWVVLDGIMARLQMDPEKSKGAIANLEKYLPLETDEARKQSVLMGWANYMREAGLTKKCDLRLSNNSGKGSG